MNELQKQAAVNETGGDVLIDIRHIVERGTLEAYQGVNTVMVLTYWKVGRRIVEEEQHGAARAAYGAGLIDFLAAESEQGRRGDREIRTKTKTKTKNGESSKLS